MRILPNTKIDEIEKLLEENSHSQGEIASLTGVSQSSVSRVNRGIIHHKISRGNINKPQTEPVKPDILTERSSVASHIVAMLVDAIALNPGENITIELGRERIVYTIRKD